MKARVESLGKLFVRPTSSVGKIEITPKKINNNEYELEIKYNKMRTVSLRIQEELYEQLNNIAERKNMTLSDVMRKAIAEFLEKEGAI